MNEISTADGAGRYEIRLKGHLDTRWAAWFDGLTLTTCSDGTTTIHGPVVDQSALHGLLQRVRDLGLPLISVTRVEPDPLTPEPALSHSAPSIASRIGSRPRRTDYSPPLSPPASSAAADARPPRRGRQAPLIPPSPQQPMPGCRWRNTRKGSPRPGSARVFTSDGQPPLSLRHKPFVTAPQPDMSAHQCLKGKPMIEVENLSKRYGTKLAVDGLNFVVQPGIVTGFLGPNGSGKSTTMRMIAGLDQPTAGRVTVNGGDYRSAAAPMAELGVLLEAKAVHTGRSARNHLLALAQTNGIKARRVDEVIDIVGLREVAGKRVGGFSLGMGQRLGRGIGAAGQPADRGPGRTGQRPGPRRGPVDAHHAQRPRRRRAHRVRVLPPDERNGPNRNTSGRHRPGPADRRHHRRRIRRPRLEPFRHRPHPGSRPAARTCSLGPDITVTTDSNPTCWGSTA